MCVNACFLEPADISTQKKRATQSSRVLCSFILIVGEGRLQAAGSTGAHKKPRTASQTQSARLLGLKYNTNNEQGSEKEHGT